MVYIDENGSVLESVDLSKGRLEDAEYVDHPEVEEVGHYEYVDLEGGGQLQKYIVDIPHKSAYREVTVQRYIRYTEEELAIFARESYEGRINTLEQAIVNQADTNDLLAAQVMAVSDRGDFIEDCIAEMAGVIYA